MKETAKEICYVHDYSKFLTTLAQSIEGEPPNSFYSSDIGFQKTTNCTTNLVRDPLLEQEFRHVFVALLHRQAQIGAKLSLALSWDWLLLLPIAYFLISIPLMI
jgi:hypothetical protein